MQCTSEHDGLTKLKTKSPFKHDMVACAGGQWKVCAVATSLKEDPHLWLEEGLSETSAELV